MVKKTKKDEPQGGGWGNPQPPADNAHVAEGSQPFPDGTAPGISTDPENRQPPMDQGWNEAAPGGEEERPVMGMAPAADPAPAEPAPKPKGKGKGKNAKPADDVPPAQSPQRNSDPLISYVERLERLAEERQTITDDMKEVVSEAKAEGYEPAILKKVLARRRRGREAVEEEEALIDTYQNVVGWDD